MISSDTTLAIVQGELTRIDAALTARFMPAEDESVDDGIDLLRAGEPTGVSIQVGIGYYGVDLIVEQPEWICYHLYMGNNLRFAAKRAAKAVLDPPPLSRSDLGPPEASSD